MNWVELVVLLGVVGLLLKPLGLYICQVLDPKGKTFLDRIVKPLEMGLYRCCGVKPLEEQGWKEYLCSILGFSLVCTIFPLIIMALQSYFPLNPQKFPAPSWHLNVNTAISFMTNTNWQSYGGESTMSYFSQMVALAVQNFISPAVGLSVAACFVRGIARSRAKTIGNFWTDVVRICLYLLLPLSIIAAVIFLWTGVPQNFQSYVQAKTLEGGVQVIAQGPIASQEAIKLLGSNGGGFTNVNSAHPYENPTPFANLIQMILLLLIPAAQIYYYGKEVGNCKHGWCIIAALAVLFVFGVREVAHFESAGNPELTHLGVSGGNWEGKEVRLGIFPSSLFACTTTATSCGAVNCMHDSLVPMAGFFPLLFMEMDEVIFGGMGAGLYSILIFIILAIFTSGLVIGRTPEYLGKKIEIFDIKMTVLAVLSYVFLVHVFVALAISTDWGLKGVANSGPHGFSEILYAFSSCTANNGSAFAGLSANTAGYNLSLAAAMLLGRFMVIVPVIALAGSFAEKKIHPQNAGSFPVSSFVFIALLIGMVLLIGALTFLPALTMGPVIEQFDMLKGVLFK